MSDWLSDRSDIRLNPRTPQSEQDQIIESLKPFQEQSEVWLRSSGTESSQDGIKMVQIKKSAILTAARSVNQVYQITENDCLLNPLPEFHIGGLSVGARSFLSGARQVNLHAWDTSNFVEVVKRENVTVVSLVPTQIYDLVQGQCAAPKTLSVVLLGGGAISLPLFIKAKSLGWPLIPTYGMTETCAMLAGAPLSSIDSNEQSVPAMELLPHVQLVSQGGRFSIESPSLFESWVFIDPNGTVSQKKRPTPFVLDDRLLLQGREVQVLGRDSELVKVLGESVNLTELSRKIEPKVNQPFLILSHPHDRKGAELYLVVEGGDSSTDLESVNSNLMPFERITKVLGIDKFPRSELGKIKRGILKVWLEKQL